MTADEVNIESRVSLEHAHRALRLASRQIRKRAENAHDRTLCQFDFEGVMRCHDCAGQRAEVPAAPSASSTYPEAHEARFGIMASTTAA